MVFLLKGSRHVDWDRILDWVEASPAARALCVLLTYLDRHRVIDVAPDILQRLCRLRRSPGPLTLRLAHALLDRYVVDGHDFGRLMSERTFNRFWKLLIVGRRGSPPTGAVRPPPASPTPRAFITTPGGLPGSPDGAVSDDGALRQAPFAVPEEGHSMNGSLHPMRRPGLRARVVDGEVVILDLRRQLVHQVNQTARYIWDRCDGSHTPLHIAGELARDFDVDLATAERDVAAAIRRLEAASLVDTHPGPAPGPRQGRRSP
jgi:hypothetical protein